MKKIKNEKMPKKHHSVTRYIPTSYEIPREILKQLADKLRNLVELSFSEKLLAIIKEKGRKPVEVYKKADVSKALFAKIKARKDYHPTKRIALAFAIALHLTLEETLDLIGRAGYALNPGSKSDVIVRFFIEEGVYNINIVNEKLCDNGCMPLTNIENALKVEL